MEESAPAPREGDESTRRSFLSKVTGLAMAGGLAAGYGGCAAIGVRYLYPARPRRLEWQFLARAADLAVGGSLEYRAPSGERIAVARHDAAEIAASFVALSSTCPHLGCQVHWEAQNERFFCPCHNGAFAPDGTPIAGPPKDAGQRLPEYRLKVEGGLLYIEVPTERLAEAGGDSAPPSGGGRPA